MRHICKIGLIVGLFTMAVGCDDGRLSEDEARRLVLEQPDFVDGATCSVPVFQPAFRDGEYYVLSRTCAEELVAAGMVASTTGERDAVGHQRVVLNGAFVASGNNMLLPCGTLTLTSVRDIATTGNEADFRYERELVLSPGVEHAGIMCDFRAPEAGHDVRERHARRDDAGHWSLVTER